MMNKVPDFPVKRKPGRPKKQPEVKEVDKLKNLIGRQDDMIAQLTDEVKRLEKVCQEFENEVDELEGKLESFKTILITVLEMDQ
jgi:predicted RNase H-like nuclease (RuvC/YqgF family)